MNLVRGTASKFAKLCQLFELLSPVGRQNQGVYWSKKIIQLFGRDKNYSTSMKVLLRHFILGSYWKLCPDPLGRLVPNEISVIMPVGPNDLDKYFGTLLSVLRNISNPIKSISLICPNELVAVIERGCEQIRSEFRIDVVDDLNLLGHELSSLIEDQVPSTRAGWYKQQFIKWLGVLGSDSEFNLLVDSDTRFLRQRNWCSDGLQLLMPVYEKHIPYSQHLTRLWEGTIPILPVSFVSHHQLVQKSKLRLMLDELGGTAEGLRSWLSQIDRNESSGASEYETYATWLIHRYPESVVLARWGNFSSASSRSNSHYVRFFRKFAWSISHHWYQT